MPALRRQKGFCHGVTSIDTIWLTAIEDTRWETKEDAEIYQQTGYPETLKMLSGVLDAEPATSIFEVADSDFSQNHKNQTIKLFDKTRGLSTNIPQTEKEKPL